MEDIIVNKVEKSGLITINPEDYCLKDDVSVFDLKDFLFQGLILKEKDYRTALLNVNWEVYRDKYVALTCSTDAVIPVWAYMLAVCYLRPIAKEIVFGDKAALITAVTLKNLETLKGEDFEGQRIVIKGCGDIQVPEFVYVEIMKKLLPFAKSIMYGEPCSTVPLYKKKEG